MDEPLLRNSLLLRMNVEKRKSDHSEVVRAIDGKWRLPFIPGANNTADGHVTRGGAEGMH